LRYVDACAADKFAEYVAAYRPNGN
jgi:hypothetical protein